MTIYRQVYEHIPAQIEIPVELQQRRVEIILRPLDESKDNGDLGWSSDFFEKTAGKWVGEPLERADQGDYEKRLPLC
jgi:hypothetical protein